MDNKSSILVRWCSSYRANISVLVLFLLVVSSLIGLMTVSYVRQMVAYNSAISQYYGAYYMAQAWLELMLVQVKHQWLWYEAHYSSGDGLISKNTFFCRGGQCLIAWVINALGTGLGSQEILIECNTGNAYTLWPWQSVIIPLFADSGSGLTQQEHPLTNMYVQPDISVQFMWSYIPDKLWIGLGLGKLGRGKTENLAVSVDEDDTLYTILSGTKDFSTKINAFLISQQKFNAHNNVLVITNPLLSDKIKQSAFQFCLITKNEKIPLSTVSVVSWGQIWDRQVWLQAIKNIALPDYLLQTYVGTE